MIVGAARELKVGDPADISVHVGPVIDAEAKQRLDAHIAAMKKSAKVHLAGEADRPGAITSRRMCSSFRGWIRSRRRFSALSCMWCAGGPAMRSADSRLCSMRSRATGFGLTGGLHTRIDETIRLVEERTPAGNLYVNRNMIGAVVGTQPFGGSGLSGTGPKAGGPHYLFRFATEQVVSINTAAAGGNASLVAMGEE